ncbi:MAG: DUF3854 domain-containing protein [Clostridia bacterium]|nr:DUF3854 domain-containing protein [Clostridia bacterium]
MNSYCDNFRFSILDVAGLLSLEIRHKGSKSVDVDCPFCQKKGKMNLNTEKNVFRCNYCGMFGGMIALYAKALHTDNSAAYREICESLRLPLSAPEKNTVPDVKDEQEKIPASLDERDQTYRLMLSLLTLSKTHKENLMARGLTESDIYRYGYKSTPAFGFSALAEKLQNLGCRLEGVPGFYRKEERWLPRFSSNGSGILIPVLSIDGKIQGAQIRLDNPVDGRKYMWFSSSEKDGGTGAGSPAHFVGDPADPVVYVTEGPLKATIAHAVSRRTFAAVAGVNQYTALEELFVRLIHNGTETIVEAYDMDTLKNPDVEQGCQKLLELSVKFGFEVRRLSWNARYKGIDDFLTAKRVKR